VRFSATFAVLAGALWLVAACGAGQNDADRAGAPPPPRPAAAPPPPLAASADETPPSAPRIVFLGDSLTAGLGLEVSASFPALIEQRLEREGYAYDVVNAGVSGDTSAGGLRRLEWALAEGEAHVLVVALGGNDGLRGLPPEQLERNLGEIIESAQRRGVAVILAGMEAPPNYGADYTARFRAVYAALARRHDVPLIPFLLDGVAGVPALNQSDGIHPNERGAQLVADLVWKALKPTLDRVRATTAR
jgi:acyl-CoA thioesterase-1